MVEEQEREASKVEQEPTTPIVGTQLTNLEELDIHLSSTRRRPGWDERTLRDVEEHVEPPSNTFR